MIWYVARLLLLLRLISLWDNVFLSWTIMMHWNAKISSYRPISMMLWHHKIIVIIYVFKICNLWVWNISYIECRFLEIQLMNFGNLRKKKKFFAYIMHVFETLHFILQSWTCFTCGVFYDIVRFFKNEFKTKNDGWWKQKNMYIFLGPMWSRPPYVANRSISLYLQMCRYTYYCSVVYMKEGFFFFFLVGRAWWKIIE